ncbi:uncharacterized protein AB675_524 [Cyphellophora attinorum]|uniref:Uncharacterized protein n=1 Tax=Cyphellophora attinorum TaxID=1664694 RepID=A0A0N1HHB1_9EURO|nr:uncharacterized protein AB675_524 [Phialophora attinorum]KPI45847.1 hypothetical protein AB675_524 [Phialophora attinorum]
MSQPLLTCKICVKKPKFSDVSHLLTHVGSKGHLAQLHKLQVKSHQDIAPAIELAEYNQWFQEHGLGQLLSERLQNKEQKQARRGVKNEAAVKAEHDSEDPFSFPVQQPARRRGPGRPKKSAQRKTSVVSAAESSVYTSAVTDYPLTPLRHSSPQLYTDAPVSSPPFKIDPALGDAAGGKANTNTKLKGKIWPGMALFDAASPEEARKRNQKKDASVVKRMERLSQLVEPAEVTYSAEWSPRKNRHIDDLDDASSLIEGESPLMIKPKPKPKRKALGSLPANVRGPSKPLPELPPLKQARRRHPSAYSAQDEEDDVDSDNLGLPQLPGYNGLEDSPSNIGGRGLGRASLSQAYDRPAPRLSFQTPAWLQPQNQPHNPLFLDSHATQVDCGNAAATLQHIDGSKHTNRIQSVDHGHLNPLAWPSPRGAAFDTSHSPISSFGPFSGFVSAMGLPDPFVPVKNPLADAFARFNEGHSGQLRV